MTFSIITPLYNKAPFVTRTLESVFAQTYADWELIIMDDGSTDDSLAVARECVEKNGASGRVHIYTQTNAGVAAARNHAVEHAQGDYLCFLDADDWWKPSFLEQMAQLIQLYPDAGLYATNYVYYKTHKTHIALDIPTGYIQYAQAYLNSAAMPIWTGTVAMPRHVFDEMGGFPVGVCLGEDFLLWAKTAMHYPVVFLNTPLAYYNNDVPATLRATRNLYAPEHSMLFLLDTIASENTLSADWKRLFDKLRVSGLMEYWLDSNYHDRAKTELAKVDWSQQSRSAKRLYHIPVPLLRLYYATIRMASCCKQSFYSYICKKRVYGKSNH
jgi:glycosyltransferase involved in cell wall biosynthesis